MADHRTALDKLQQQRDAKWRLEMHTAVPMAADGSSGDIIHDLRDADLRVISVNEWATEQKPSETDPEQPAHDDPVAEGFGAWANPLGRLKWYIAKIRFHVMRWRNGARHRTEVIFIKAAIDELYDGDNKPLPLLAFYMTRDSSSSQDADQQPVAIFTRDGIRFLAPVYMEAGSQAGPPVPVGIPRAFRSDHEKYHYNVQDDPTPEYPHGRIVQYDRHGSDNPDDWTAVAILKPAPISVPTTAPDVA